jgi:hypothetical protein
VIEVWVERLNPAMGEDFGWERVQATPRAARSNQASEAGAVGVEQSDIFRFIPANEVARALELHHARRFDALLAEGLVDTGHYVTRLWEGDVSLPASRPAGSRFRLVIAEYEEYLVDDDRPYDKVPTRKDRRLVFVEHVELT